MMNMKIGRMDVKKVAKKLINKDYEELKERTALVDEDPKTYTDERLDVLLNEDFNIYTSGDLLRIEVKRGQLMFLKNFVTMNVDNRFVFSADYDNKDLTIRIDKDSINDVNFDRLIEYMYLHTLI